MDLPVSPTEIFVDNKPIIQLAKHPMFHPRTKHIELHYHEIRHVVNKGIVEVKYVPTDEQVADIFTKALPKAKFEKFGQNMLIPITK